MYKKTNLLLRELFFDKTTKFVSYWFKVISIEFFHNLFIEFNEFIE